MRLPCTFSVSGEETETQEGPCVQRQPPWTESTPPSLLLLHRHPHIPPPDSKIYFQHNKWF